MSDSNKIDLKDVNKIKKEKLRLKKTFDKSRVAKMLKKQNGPVRDEEGKFSTKATVGSGGLAKVAKLNLKRALPIFAIVTLIGGSLVYQSFATACSISADRTTLYEGESTTIRWKSPAVPVVINGGNMGSVKDGQWGTGSLNSTKTFKLVGGWDSSCTGSVTVSVQKKPAAAPVSPPANPGTGTTPVTSPGTSTSSALTEADNKFKWTDSQVKTARQNRDKARTIANGSTVSRVQLDSIGTLEKWVKDAVIKIQ